MRVMQYKTTVLHENRLLKGLSIKSLAELVGVHPSTISRIEAGQFQKPETIKKIAQALEVPMEDLIVKEVA